MADEEAILEDQLMLTTMDNPYSPKTEYDEWKQWDEDNGYNTESYIARLMSFEGFNDIDDEFTIELLTTKVVNDILNNDTEGIYRLV